MWNSITSGFDVEDETANFGTRAVAESEVAVFETNTLATIQAENRDELSSIPAVYAEYYLELGCCLVIDNSVALFNENCSQTLLSLTFDTKIDTVRIIGSGKFIFIGLDNGELHFYHISSKTVIFTRSFSPKLNSLKTFVKIEFRGDGESLEIFIITTMEKLYRITNLKLDTLETACENKDSVSVEKLGQSIVVNEMFGDSAFNFKVTSGCGLDVDDTYSFLLVGKDLYFMPGDDIVHKTCPLHEEFKLRKIELTQNKSLCFGLTETGKLVVLCMHTLMPIFVWDDLHVVDFTLLDGLDAENNILIITGGEIHNMLLMSWPGFQVKFKLQVQPFSYLVYQQSGSEDILYVEGFGEEKINTIRLKAIVESQPEFRLQRILRKGRFEEAEKFARTFNLNIELVYRAQIQRLMQDLQPWNNTPESVRLAFVKFMALLEKITDIEFVSECCINAIPPDFKATQMLLEYGRIRLSKLPEKSESYIRSDLLQKISSISQRLSTFQQIHGSSANSDSWLHFLKADLFKECQKHLKRGEIRESVFIWSRHLYEIKAKINWNQILLLLEENIPTWVKAKDIALWLRQFVPPILAVHPDIPQYILQWTIGKIKTLEVSERESWPDVGLDLAFNVLRILEVSFSVHDPLLALQENTLRNNQCTPKSPFNRLLAFIKNLQDMQTLKNNYGVVISCIDFLQLSDQELMIVILERTPIEKIKLLMKDFLKKMILERNLVSDIVISNFIKEFVNSSVDWSQWDEAPWERMVAALIPCIHGIQERLESVLHVLDVAPVPWTSVIKCIAEDALKLKHPLTNAVQECVNIIPQKLILKKYGFKKDLLLGKKSVTVIKRILLLDQESALQDVLKIAESITDKCFSHQIILKYLIEKDNYQAALEVLAGLDSEVASACKDYILNLARQYLKINSMEKVGHYIKILPLICTDAEWFPAKKCYSLKMDKKVDCSPQDFCYKSAKNKRLSDHTTVILKGLLEKQLTEEEVVSKISRYVHLLDISYEEWIVSIATQAVHCQFSLAYSLSSNIKHLNHLSDDEHTKVLTLAVSLLAYYRTEADMSTVEDLVKLICKLATQSVIHCSSDYVDKALDMLIWFGLLKSASGTHRNVFNDIYTDPAPSSPTIISLHFHVQNMLLQYIKSAPSNNRSIKLDSRVLEAFEGASENNLLKENIVSKFPTIFRQLRDEQQNITGICLLISFSWSLWSLDVVFEAGDIENILNLSIIDLLKKLTNSRHFDLPLALGLLNYFEENEALLKLSEIEKSVALNYQKLSSLSLLGLTYCNMYKIESYWKHFTKKRAQCTWAKKLSELGISYKEAFKESDHDQKQLLLKLMKTPGVTLALLEEYCTSMRVYFQDCLEIYLEEILLSWEPDIEFKTNNSGKKDLLVKHSSDDLKKRCLAIIDMTNSETKQQIETTLQSLWNKINYYYYEVFIVIIELVEERLTKCRTDDFNRYKLLLGFLSNYIRISEAQSDEKENWFQIRPSTQNLPPIAEFRLPFTLLLEGDPWKIIKPELNLTTYKMWFYVISILRLDKNTLCSLTIHRLTSNHLSAGDSTEDPSGWCVHLKNRALLADIKECVGNITNLEMASASLYYVVSHMPPGADQVAAAEMCYIEAQKWVNLENSEKAEKGLAKVEKKYLTVSTSHILHSHQLGEQKYLQLVLLPDELIYELYHDPSILKRKSGCTNHLPDINRAVGAIAALNTLNITKIRLDILTDWLQAGNMNLDTSVDDTTCNITVAMFNHRFDPASTVENENLIRACYLLESIDEIKAATYLSAFAFGNDDGESRNILVKLRALQCLCAVTSNNITKQVTGRDLAEIRRHMQQLLFIYELEKLGLAWSADKSEIVRILLKRTNPQAVSIAAAICREFNLNIPEFWDSILARMVAIEMIEALCLVLPDLTPYSHLLNSEVFKNGWNFVILTPLSKAVYPMNEEETRKVENSIEMLHKCPIPFEIDFATINKHCQRLHAEDLLIQLGHL